MAVHLDSDTCCQEWGKYRKVRSNLSEGAKKGVEWLTCQNDVLEEVDQLVELMAAEKAALNSKITRLKEEHKELLRRETALGDENAKLKVENLNKQSMLAMQEEQGAKVTRVLKESVEMAKQQLDETRLGMDSLRLDLGQTQDESRRLATENCDLRSKMVKFKDEFASLSSNLELQRGENDKMTGALSCLREQCRKLQVQQNFLRTREKDLQDKLRISEDMILAMKGRANSAKRYEEQLKLKVRSLEHALDAAACRPPTVVKVPSVERSSRVEMELLRECKKKDEALANCTSELARCRAEQKRHQMEKSKLERQLHAERRKNSTLSRELEELKREKLAEERTLLEKTNELNHARRKLSRCMSDLRASKKKEMEFSTNKAEVDRGLSHIQEELRRSKIEMREMKMEVESKEQQWWTEKQRAEQEKLRMIKSHHQTIEKLQEDLLRPPVDDHLDCWMEAGAVSAGENELRLSRLLQDAKEDYRRLKEASAKRCSDLAKEVWSLKEQLNDYPPVTSTYPTSPTSPTGYQTDKLCAAHQRILRDPPMYVTDLS